MLCGNSHTKQCIITENNVHTQLQEKNYRSGYFIESGLFV